MRLTDAAAIWGAGLELGLATIRREPVLGLKRLVLPSSYWRTAEFAYVFRQLDLPRGARVLDLGSPKDLALMLARKRGYHVTATDIRPEAVELCERFARAQGIIGDGPGQVRCEVQDGRRLTYPTGHFDAVYSVSVVEHIPDQGDTSAIQELVRVTRPGGRVVVTTPHDRGYRETFLTPHDHWYREAFFSQDDYERAARTAQPVFWERHYDGEALERRLVAPSGARLVNREVWGEGGFRGEQALARLGAVRILLSPFEAAFAAGSLKHMRDEADAGHPMAMFFTLERPEL